MSRAATVAVALVAALIAAVPASAQERGWRPPTLLTGNAHGEAWRASEHTTLTTTSAGETIAIWSEQTAEGEKSRIATVSADGVYSGAQAFEAVAGSYSVRLASDSLGNAFVVYGEAGAAKFKVRPPGGSFGSEETLDTGGMVPRLFVAPDGDIAALWVDGSGGKAAFRPRDGAFGPATSVPQAGGAAAYSSNGDLVQAAPGGGNPARVSVSVRSATGEVTNQTLQGHPAMTALWPPAVAIDDSGRAVVTWAESRAPEYVGIDAVRMAQRPSGGAFGAATALPRVGDTGPKPRLVMSRDGLYTLAYSGTQGTRVVSARAGEPPSLLRSFGFNGYEDNIDFVASPTGNHALLSRGGHMMSPMTAVRSGDGPFARARVLLTDCGEGAWTRVAIGDGGHGAAVVRQGSRLMLVTDQPAAAPAGPACGLDDWDPYRPRTSQPDGSGTWTDAPTPRPEPEFPRPAIPVGLPQLRPAAAGALDRLAKVVAVCGKECTLRASATLGFWEEGPLAEARARTTSTGRAKAIAIPLQLTKAEAQRIDRSIAEGRSTPPLFLTITITATDAKTKKKRTRTVQRLLNGGPRPF